MDTNAERQARWRQRQKARIEAAANATAEELALAKERIAALESAFKAAEEAEAAARAELASVIRRLEMAKKDLRDEIDRLKKVNKELRTKIDNLTYGAERLRSNGMMPLATARAIAKCLHPDRTPSAEEREYACKLFQRLSLIVEVNSQHRGRDRHPVGAPA
jgi:chromosome segregation ATPase